MLAVLGLAVVLAAIGGMVREHAPPSQPVPATASAAVQQLLSLTLNDQAGQSHKLAQWRGRPLLINFWASWCAPCREEMPLLDEMARQQGGNGGQVLGIAWDRAANVAEYVRAHRVDYPLLVADAQARALLPALGNPARALPFSVLVAADGSALRLRLGALRAAEAATWLANHSVANGSKLK